jgi:UDP-glucose 4-epimerase
MWTDEAENNFCYLQGDYGDKKFLESLPDVECIIHAGSPFHPREIMSPNLLQKVYDKERFLLEKITSLACNKRLKNVIYLSSAGEIYGNRPDLLCGELTSEEPITQYGEFKLSIESTYISALKFENVLDILRISNPYGRPQTFREDRNFINVSIKRVLDGLPINIWGDGKQGRDYLYIDDFLSAVGACLKKPINGFRRLNIGSGENISLVDTAELIIKTLGRGGIKFVQPDFVAPIKNNFLDIENARLMLGWGPEYDLAEGIEKSVKQFVKMNKAIG